MAAPLQSTIETWAADFVTSTDLATKLAPGPAPKIWADGPAPLRIALPGRPEQLALGYMLCIGLLGMLPLRVFHTFWIGIIIVVVNLSYDLTSSQVPTIITLVYCFGLIGSLIIACATAYFREIGLREIYEAKHAPER